MRGSGSGAPARAAADRLLETGPRAGSQWYQLNRRARLAPEGGGDLGAAFLKNRRTHDHQQPQGGEKGEGAQSCNHRIDPFVERLTELDLFRSISSIGARVRR
jgi:hypothetical protein